jgi:DNA-binding NtrC family response regulator
MLIRLLLSVEPAPLRRRLIRLLEMRTVVLVPVRSRRLLQELHGQDVDLVVVSRARLPEPAAEALRSVRSLPERPEVVVVSDREDPEERARLLAAGAMAVVYQRLPDDALRDLFETLLAGLRVRVNDRLLARRSERVSRLSDFVSESPAMGAFLDVARHVVSSDSSILILGETGVGKERLARALHDEGPRSAAPFIAINCGALTEGLLESELFGHEEGAFTGATRSRRGFFELAHLGTLFLDEIGELPHHLQVKLLRALQDREIRRVGGEHTVPVDVRLIAATNRPLEADVASKRFRADLYYRLAVVTLTIPPLRERRDDIEVLARAYLESFRRHLGRPAERFSPEALDALVRHEWPGNVRELMNVIERAVLLCPAPEIGLAELPEPVRVGAGVAEDLAGADLLPGDWFDRPLKDLRSEVVGRLERAYLARLLEQTAGRIGEAAVRAGVDERSVYNLMRRHGLDKDSFKH